MNDLDISYILMQYNSDLTINLDGYSEFIDKYQTVTGYDIDTVFDISKKALLWYDYLCEIEHIANLILMDMDNQISVYKIYYGDNSPQLTNVLKQRKITMAFRKRLREEKKLCNKIHYQADAIYKNGMRNLNKFV